MDLFQDSELSSAVLLMKYGPLPKKRRDINSACRSGTRTTPATTGATPIEHRNASHLSNSSRGNANEDLQERLLRLANAEFSGDRAPIHTYTVTPEKHGEVYKARGEFIDWLRRKIPCRRGLRNGYGELSGSSPARAGEIPIDL